MAGKAAWPMGDGSALGLVDTAGTPLTLDQQNIVEREACSSCSR